MRCLCSCCKGLFADTNVPGFLTGPAAEATVNCSPKIANAATKILMNFISENILVDTKVLLNTNNGCPPYKLLQLFI